MKQIIPGQMSKEELKEWAMEEVRIANGMISQYRALSDINSAKYRDTVYYWKGYRNALLAVVQVFADPGYPTEEEYISWPH